MNRSEGLIQRKNISAKVEECPANVDEEQEDPHDDDESKDTRLTLMEEILLLGLKDREAEPNRTTKEQFCEMLSQLCRDRCNIRERIVWIVAYLNNVVGDYGGWFFHETSLWKNGEETQKINTRDVEVQTQSNCYNSNEIMILYMRHREILRSKVLDVLNNETTVQEVIDLILKKDKEENSSRNLISRPVVQQFITSLVRENVFIIIF
ncbi:GOLPH3 (predicted) [Pycnogonum litorale]